MALFINIFIPRLNPGFRPAKPGPGRGTAIRKTGHGRFYWCLGFSPRELGCQVEHICYFD